MFTKQNVCQQFSLSVGPPVFFLFVYRSFFSFIFTAQQTELAAVTNARNLLQSRYQSSTFIFIRECFAVCKLVVSPLLVLLLLQSSDCWVSWLHSFSPEHFALGSIIISVTVYEKKRINVLHSIFIQFVSALGNKVSGKTKPECANIWIYNYCI